MADDELAPPTESQAPAPPEPTPAVEAAPAEPEAAIDPNEVDLRDEGKVRGLLAELSRQRGANRDLKAKAEKADQLEQYVNSKAHLIRVLEENPDLLKRPPAEPPKPPDPQEDPEAVETARLMDFWKPDGTPDAKRGAQLLDAMEKRAARVSQQAVQPYAQQALQARASANYQMLRNMKALDGSPISPKAVDAIWNQLHAEPGGAEKAGDPESVKGIAMVILSADALMKGNRPAPPPPALETEAPGTPPRRSQPMSELEEKIARDRGKTADHWQKQTKDFRAGRSNALED